MGNAGGDLGAVDKPVQVGQLFSVGEGNVGWLVELQQVVEVLVPSAEDFSLIDLRLRAVIHAGRKLTYGSV